jgi:tetratricopeptide (TPR) repeat protein
VFARGNLGVSYGFAGDYDAALPVLDEAIRLSPRDPLLIIWHLCKGWAALLSERYQEAVEFTTEAAGANAEFPDNYAVLAAAHGHLGNAVPSRAALDELLRRMPRLTVADERLNRPFGSAVQRERFLEGLRQAGLLEG